jgi:multiple antibiotic resistance protein
MPDTMQIFSMLFLMLGPFKIIGTFTKITHGADPKLVSAISNRAVLYASIALVLAAVVGESVIMKFGIPLPVLALSAGIILFLVALRNIIQQYGLDEPSPVVPVPPTMKMAMTPLAFPTIVTPYGIATVIVLTAISPELQDKVTVLVIVLIIMVINLILMMVNRYIYKVLAVCLPILGAVLGVIQVALGLKIIYNSLRLLLEAN